MQDNNNRIIVALGWLGGVIVLTAYGLNSAGIISPNSLIYHFMNIVGSLMLILIAYKEKAYPNVFVNVAWIAIAIISILNIFLTLKT